MSRPSPAERRAMLLIDALKISSPPVPVEQIAAAKGAQLTYEAFDGQVSGMLYRDEQRAIIGINSRHAAVRQRFTIAHEIGHLEMHKGKPVFVDRLVRMNLRDGSSSREESDANAFAAELLMPRKLMAGEVNRILSRKPRITPEQLIEELASRFRVSSEAMGYRLANLGILNPYSGSGI